MPHEDRRVTAHEEYELWAPTYDATPNAFVAMDARHSMHILEPLPGELVLDAGCGTGRNLSAIVQAGARVVGVDFSAGMLAVAHAAHPTAPLLIIDLQATLPFAGACFDAVLCSLVADHLEDAGPTIAELRRVLKPGGRLVLSVAHPALAARGVEARFERDGIEYRLRHQAYGVQDYLDFIVDAGFDGVAFAEYRANQPLADQVEGAQEYVGAQILLLIAATA